MAAGYPAAQLSVANRSVMAKKIISAGIEASINIGVAWPAAK
jgi:hypothetical protein